jgi:hypothetical protein
LTAEAQLTLRCRDAKVAKGLEQVLSPDNAGFPRGQRFAMTRKGRTLLFIVDGEATSSFFSTVYSVLRDASLFQEIWLLSRGEDAEVGSRP